MIRPTLSLRVANPRGAISVKQFSIFLVGALVLTACGKGSLTDEQKAKIQGVNNSVKAVGGSGGGSSTKSALSARSFLGNELSQEGIDEETQKRLHAKLVDGKCDIKSDSNAKSGSSLVSANVDVSGTSCPITLKMRAGVSGQESTGGKTEIIAEYSSKDEEFTRLSKLKAFKINGSMEMGSDSMKLLMDADIDSVEYGHVTYHVNFDIQSISGQRGLIEIKVTFPDFTKSLRAEGQGENVKYQIDGKDADKDEVEALIKSFQ